jgi:hypothetical protein
LLKESGLDLETFFAKSQILEKLIGNPDLLDQQIMSHLTEDRKDSTVMDRAMYFLTVLSENPTKYY